MLNVILQFLWLVLAIPLSMSIVMGMQNFIKIYQKVQRIGLVSLFSEFEPRQNLDLSQISFDTIIGYMLSISMCTQNFITIFFTVLEIGPFSPFQNLERGKASTDKKNVSWQSLGLDLVNINVYAKVYQNIPLSLRDGAIFTFFRILALGKASTDDKCHLQFIGLDLFNIKLSAKFYQNIPNALRVNFHFFQNLNLGKTSTNPKCHLTISWAASCQHTNVYAKFHRNIPLRIRIRVVYW